MDPGHKTSASTYKLAPSTKLLAWALVTGAVLVIGAIRDGQPPQPSAAQAFAAPSTAPTPSRTAPPALRAVRTLPAAAPVRIRIPSIKVNAPVTKLGLDRTGALRPPPGDDPNLAGWYSKGTTPGSAGTALIAGHVDLRGGRPGVFFSLGALTKGATIRIGRSDGRTAVFTVDAVEVYSKADFPSEKVYAGSGRPELRVITCGGGYAKNTGYLGNVVVYASLTAVK
ncbi:class F sortase [Streptomyces sp. HUAS ZL42]|uniref:class F sortase n=1 Tax=Streptomyces sp. HUAS ZL42 TaxID=3231715 RepID=UPI00345E7F3E